ncbi:MAG: ribonuclease HII [Actinomycetota bacterium]|nr:ribonuclease HII [Actinomycetota bacterium]
MNFNETKRLLNLCRYENVLCLDGYEVIAGVDEAGRGSLAGPLVAAAVIMNKQKMMIENIDDSKKLNKAKREHIFRKIIKNCICWSVARISPGEIDRISITRANVFVFKKAVGGLRVKPDIVLADFVNGKLGEGYIPVVRGDQLSVSIAAASIIAKVIRDKIMIKLSKYYPEYGLESNKGYGTRQHLLSLEKYGPSVIHRASFRGVLS